MFFKQRFSFYQVVGNACSFVKIGLNKVILLLVMGLSAYSKSTLNLKEGLNHQALKKALQYSASSKYKKRISNDKYVVIIDYTMPSNKERLFLYNTQTKKVEHKFLVAHGKGSGRGAYAEKFSNTSGWSPEITLENGIKKSISDIMSDSSSYNPLSHLDEARERNVELSDFFNSNIYY